MAVAIALPGATGNVISTTGPVKLNGVTVYCTAAGDGVTLRDKDGSGVILATVRSGLATNSVNVCIDDGVIAPSGVIHATLVGATAPVGSIHIQ